MDCEGTGERRCRRLTQAADPPQCEFGNTTDPASVRDRPQSPAGLDSGYSWVECNACEAGWQVPDCVEEGVG
jgi:hypothetical protein